MPIRKFLDHNAFNPETILEPRPGRPSFPITCPASAAHLMAEPEGPLWVKTGNARSEDIESAFHRKADIARRGWKVRFGPTADSGNKRAVTQRMARPPAEAAYV